MPNVAGITLAQAEQQLAEALTALSAARQAQDVSITASTGGRRIQRAPLESLSADVKYWQAQVSRLSRGGDLRTWSAVPL